MSTRKQVNRTILSRQSLDIGVHRTVPLNIAESTAFSFQVAWEGSPAAAIVIQTSNDPRVERHPDDAVWFTEPTTVSGCDGDVADGSIMKHVDNVNSGYARIQLTVTTAGTITVYGTGKA